MIFLKPYIIFSRKGLIALFAAILISILICGQLYAVGDINLNADTNAKRIAFIKSLGVIPDEQSVSSKKTVIPESFSDVYLNYNEVQKSAGYDLTAYKGCEATVFTYDISTPKGYSGNCAVHLIVYKGRIVGGDISSTELGGFMLPLRKIEETE